MYSVSLPFLLDSGLSSVYWGGDIKLPEGLGLRQWRYGYRLSSKEYNAQKEVKRKRGQLEPPAGRW